METPRFQLYKKKKELWIFVPLAGLVAFVLSPIADSTPGYLYALTQGTGTELNGYKIHTGLKYLYQHHEYLGGVSVSKMTANYTDTDSGYYLSFDEGAKKEVAELNQLCAREISNCETISFDGYDGTALSTYIKTSDEIISRTIYFNSACEVFISHMGHPFDSKYIEMVERFFHDNCNETNS